VVIRTLRIYVLSKTLLIALHMAVSNTVVFSPTMALLGAARQNSNCLDPVRMRNRLCFFSTVTSSSSLSAAKRIAPGSVHEARGRILGLQVVAATALGEVEPPDDAKGAVRFNIAPVKQTGGSRPRRRTCRRCSGTTKVACKDCKGAGQLPR
jgi:hypothetical protein